jgi:predicted DNA-binding protein (UPF0251 family)
MPRPCKRRRIMFRANVHYYKPAGVSLRDLKETKLEPDELEAIRLADFEGIKQKEAAKRMDVSQSTFNRILSSGRKKLAEAIIQGNSIRIEDSLETH